MKKRLLSALAAVMLAMTVTPTILMAENGNPPLPRGWVALPAPTATPTTVMAENGNPPLPRGW